LLDSNCEFRTNPFARDEAVIFRCGTHKVSVGIMHDRVMLSQLCFCACVYDVFCVCTFHSLGILIPRTHTHTLTYSCTHTHTHKHSHTHTHIHTYTHTHTHKHTHVHTPMHTQTHRHVYVCVCAHARECMRVCEGGGVLSMLCLSVCLSVCLVFVCVRVCIVCVCA